MSIKIALAGNPNCGKTTLFNALTGSNQFVGNWPGVTVEKKEGKLKGHKDVTIVDLPGIYSLSPYTLEEVVARNYLIGERPDAILNIVDGTNIERNLYLSTQLMELGIPVIMAVNMMDVLEKNGDKIHIDKLSKNLGCEVVEISALKGNGVQKAAEKAVSIANRKNDTIMVHKFADQVENVLESIEDKIGAEVPEEQKRFFAIKLLEKDDKIAEQMKQVPDVSEEIKKIETEFDDDTESVITNERYTYISSIIDQCCTKSNKKEKLTISDKIDKIVTNRILALPIFAVIMFLVYYVSVTTVGTWATDWANDGVFGDGWHLFSIGSSAYTEDADAYGEATSVIEGYVTGIAETGVDTSEVEDAIDSESEEYDGEQAVTAVTAFAAAIPDGTEEVTYEVEDEETLEISEETATKEDFMEAIDTFAQYNGEEPDPAEYGVWVPGVPVLVEGFLETIGCGEVLSGLILDGIIAGVGEVLGFVPQMLVLFIFLAFLEACGYMARVAFIMDRIFRRFGLSGKSFIPILIGTGCGIPGIMASRTIENERDRRMTIMTTTFIPCGAKLPFIALMAGAIFGGAAWVAPVCYFIGILVIICSGIILKKTKMFAGDPAPFVMELPAYHLPTVGNVLRSMWERGWSFIKKAGTIILLSTILIWYLSFFGFVDGHYTMLTEDQMSYSILARIGNAVSWIFIPLGWGNWQATVGAVTGLVAKENIVATLGILYASSEANAITNIGAVFTIASGFSFLAFNLLCAPCFAAMGAIKREMNNVKWFWFAIGYQMLAAYVVAFCIYQIGTLITAGTFGIGTVIAFLVVIGVVYLLFRPYKESKTLKVEKKFAASIK